ncbi:hypothetical protein LX36DRAFT_585330 [Colletotrichum falcatum]|nr:hypothetical protein LX36DRAFT_585330 [Colletotrichum falcatum]
MITLPSSYSTLDGYADDLARFISTPLFRQVTGGIHVNDALVYDAWEALPSEWTAWWSAIPDHRLAQQDLIDGIGEPDRPPPPGGGDGQDQQQRLRGRPESLSRWLATLRSLSLPRAQRPGPSVDLPEVLTGRMRPKKAAEVSVAAAHVRRVCEAHGVAHVVDMGSGQGYLSVALAFLYPGLRVLAIDGSAAQIEASEAAAAGLGIPRHRIRHMRRHVDGGGGGTTAPLLAAEIAAWAGGRRCMLVGLHACGSLSEHMLRYFATVPCITHLAAVGCCYNHIVPRSAACPDGFPISASMRGRGVALSATALMTGCQAPENWERRPGAGAGAGGGDDDGDEESEYSRRRFYRALLEKVLFDKGIELDRDNRPVWGVRKGDTASFAKFARRAAERLGIDGDGGGGIADDDELAAYEERYRGCSARVAILWTLGVLCCKVVESVIALDRYCFLAESGGRDVDVVPIFDYRTSPRNLMLVASKGPEDQPKLDITCPLG